MSPEQIRSSKGIDHRSDLWSLGVVLFRCLTGRRPFEGSTNEILRMISSEVAPLYSKVVGRPAKAFDAFFARALARHPRNRFESAREMVREFEVAASREAIVDSSHAYQGALISEAPTVAVQVARNERVATMESQAPTRFFARDSSSNENRSAEAASLVNARRPFGEDAFTRELTHRFVKASALPSYLLALGIAIVIMSLGLCYWHWM